MHRWRAERAFVSAVGVFMFSMAAIVFFRLECCLGFDNLHAAPFPLPLPLGSCAFAWIVPQFYAVGKSGRRMEGGLQTTASLLPCNLGSNR